MRHATSYRGFIVEVDDYETPDGRCAGSYEVRAASPEAKSLYENSKIARTMTKTIIETSELYARNPSLLERDFLIAEAQREIDRAYAAADQS
jgi:hypothetical protein